MATAAPFHDLLGLWVTRFNVGISTGSIALISEEQFHEDDVSHEFRVLFVGITSASWDREQGESTAINREVAVEGKLERVVRDGDRWDLSGSFGHLVVTAREVLRNDWHDAYEPTPVPDLDIEPPHACEAMVFALADEDDGMKYIAQFREYGYAYIVGDSSIHVIDFCPFCGAELPPGLREEWFNRVRALGLEPFDDEVPEPLQSDRWWREADLEANPPAADTGSARRLPPF